MYILSCDNTKIDEIQEIIDKKTIDFEYRNYKRRNIEEDSLLLKIKPLTEYIKNNNILENQDFITVIFKKIYETYQYKNIDINSYIGFEQNLIKKYNEWIKNKEISELDKKQSILINSLDVCEIYENSTKNIDFVNKMKYNKYTNIDKLIYQINQVAQAFD